jgi:hypothetical protein
MSWVRHATIKLAYLRTAIALGLDVPLGLVNAADEIIE